MACTASISAFSAFESQLKTLCLQEFPCGIGSWVDILCPPPLFQIQGHHQDLDLDLESTYNASRSNQNASWEPRNYTNTNIFWFQSENYGKKRKDIERDKVHTRYPITHKGLNFCFLPISTPAINN